VARVALIYNPDNPNSAVYRQIAEEASAPFGIMGIAAPIHGLDDINRAVSGLGDGRKSGAYFLPDVTTLALRKEIVELVARHAVSAMYWDASFVKLGGLVFYGVDRVELFRQSADYVEHFARREAVRPSNPGANQIRAVNQSQDRYRAWTRYSANAACDGRRGNRLGHYFAALHFDR